MNKSSVALVALIAFMAGDALAVLRTRKKVQAILDSRSKKHARILRNHVNEIELHKSRTLAFQNAYWKIYKGTPAEEAGEQLEYDLYFAHVIQPKL